MELEDEDLRKCVEAANELADNYEAFVHVKQPRKSLDDLLDLYSSLMKGNVSFEEVIVNDPLSSTPRGGTLPYDGPDGKPAYKIGVLPDDDENMRRIVTTNEIFQAILDTDSSRDMSLYDHIAAMYAGDLTEAVKKEEMAEVAMMQFLYPYKDRVNDLKLLSESKLTYEEIVNWYGIPQNYVELYLTKPYMDKLRSSHYFTVVAGTGTG